MRQRKNRNKIPTAAAFRARYPAAASQLLFIKYPNPRANQKVSHQLGIRRIHKSHRPAPARQKIKLHRSNTSSNTVFPLSFLTGTGCSFDYATVQMFCQPLFPYFSKLSSFFTNFSIEIL